MKNSTRHSGNTGFTLIELLIGTAILGLLAIFASHAVVNLARSVVVDSAVRSSAATPPELSLAAQLVQLAGLAVLLFGAGFWYTVEMRQPGRLDAFRLGHFLLLALTFSLFFVVFAVLDARELPTWMAAGIAAAISYPLVVAHVSTVIGWRFAVCGALPLAALTTGIVVNGVYGGDLRSLIYLGMLCAVVTFLTCTYPRMARGIEAHRQKQEAELTRQTTELAATATAMREEIATSHVLLDQPDTPEQHGLRQWLEQRGEHASRTLESFERLANRHDAMLYLTSRRERQRARQHGEKLATELCHKLPQAQKALLEACESLTSSRQHTQPKMESVPGEIHCVACGHSSEPDSQFCCNCGRASAERRPCPRCATVLHLPRHLLRATDNGLLAATHCPSCGALHPNAG